MCGEDCERKEMLYHLLETCEMSRHQLERYKEIVDEYKKIIYLLHRRVGNMNWSVPKNLESAINARVEREVKERLTDLGIV